MLTSKAAGCAISSDNKAYTWDMKKIAVICINKKRPNTGQKELLARLRERMAHLRTTQRKKAVILFALLIPLVFLVLLIFSRLNV